MSSTEAPVKSAKGIMLAKRGLAFFMFICFLSLIMLAGCKVLGSVTGEGNPLNGISLKLTGDRQAESTTESDGKYEFTVFQGTYTVTPAPKPDDVFFPSAKQVFVRPWKPAAVKFGKLADSDPYFEPFWEPSIVVPIQAYPKVRGKKVMRATRSPSLTDGLMKPVCTSCERPSAARISSS